MKAALDLTEELKLEKGHQNASNIQKNNELLDKRIILDGMINLTGKGARLAVLKASDAHTKKSIGRIQARRVDEVNHMHCI